MDKREHFVERLASPGLSLAWALIVLGLWFNLNEHPYVSTLSVVAPARLIGLALIHVGALSVAVGLWNRLARWRGLAYTVMAILYGMLTATFTVAHPYEAATPILWCLMINSVLTAALELWWSRSVRSDREWRHITQ